MTGLASEFRCLAYPLRNIWSTGGKSHGKPGISPETMS
jgi:hypothetical protein